MWDADSLSRSLEKLDGVGLERNLELSSVTSFRVGGPADLAVVAQDSTGLAGVLGLVRETKTRCFVLGAGTNVVFEDAGFRGLVLRLGEGFTGLERDGNSVVAGAAVRWQDLVSYCVAQSLGGLERMAGIPGSVGGAIAGNAGAFGVSVGEAVEEVTGFDWEGNRKKVESDGIRFGYRCADFGTELVLTGCRLVLREAESGKLEAEVAEVLSRRRERQPLEFPSAGSVFKNPAGMKAGRLIEEAGLKGRQVGGAQVSEKHANFIVNRGGATSSDISSLIELVREDVWKKFSVSLELEIKVVK